uniref:C2H2-type domain-containing protein n=1 Tax=Oryzias sinensis TaxID=183150 RepID=A0A8C7WUQ7_9TELE
MLWKCKYCPLNCEKRAQLFKHYRLKHGSYARTEPFPCLYQECPCTFKSLNALKVHLSRLHTKTVDQQPDAPVKFCCLSCGFAESCSQTDYLTHLHTAHLKVNHKVRCPYKDCNFETSIYSTFKAHKSKVHHDQNWKSFKSEIIGLDNVSDDNDAAQDQMSHADDMDDLEDVSVEASENELRDLEKQLEHNLASLLLKMQTVLHIPESSVQEVIQQLCQINKLSQPLLHNRVRAVLKKYYADINETVVREVTNVVSESNIMSFCAKDGSLGTAKKRAAYVRREFPLVNPIEYCVEKGKKTLAYVPIVPMLQKLLNKTDILDKAMSEKVHVPQEYSSYVDGQCFNKNSLLARDEFTIALTLYIDDFEVANPLGTSKLKHKMCAIYWVIANIPAKYRSTLNSIQLALLCNTSTVKECGYAKVLQPLIYDLKLLEQNGVYLEQLGESVKGTVLYVVADNLGAHSLAGFLESFTTDKFCRFCSASSFDKQYQEMAEQENITMRVIVSEGDIRKMTTKRPDTLEDLIGWLKGNLKANYSFTLQYQDPEFNNELCNLTNLSELPEKPTIKIIPMIELVPISADTESYGDTSSQADTEILSNSSLDRSFQWPENQGHPPAGMDGRTVSSSRWETTEPKCARLDELMSLSMVVNVEEGRDDHNLEEARQVLVNEMMKTKPNGSLVKKNMDLTFALRRKEVVQNKPAISQMLHRWPALFTESQVFYEFSRVVGKSLQDNFFDELDHFSPRLVDLFRKKKGLTGQLLAELLRQTKTTEPTDIRCLCLRGLPVILADDSSAFFRTCTVS